MNKLIIERFGELIKQIKAEQLNAQLEGDQGEVTVQGFRLKSTMKAFNALRMLDFEVKDSKDLKGIPGIGKGTMQRVQEILDTGTLAELKHKYTKEKQSKITSIQELEEVIGIGPVLAKKLVVDHGITSVDKLKAAIKSGKYQANDKIKLGLKYVGVVEGKIPRKEVTKIKSYLQKMVAKVDPGLQMIICGSYRRGKATSGDIDVLLYHPEMKTLDETKQPEKHGLDSYLEIFVDDLKDDGFIVDHITDKNYKTNYMGFARYKNKPVRRIDIKLIPFKSLHTATLYFTGPGELNVMMRQRADKKFGMLLNQYGLYKKEGDNLVKLKINSEKDVFDKLKMEYLTPQQREDFAGTKPVIKSLKK